MEKVIVFDLGGTLMEYEGMPLSWIPYYEKGIFQVNNHWNLGLSDSEIQMAVQVLKEYNPRFRPREVEYSPEKIFAEVVKSWRPQISQKVSIEQVIEEFFQGLNLVPQIYSDTLPVLHSLREQGYKLACLTNLPSAMPDKLFQKGIMSLIETLDFYMSSELCGYRKPNRAGLDRIAEVFQVSVETLLFVGDEPLDAQTARNAGCGFILMDRGKNHFQWGQTASIETLSELSSIGGRGETP